MKLRKKKTGKVTEIEEINLVVWDAERDCYDSFEEYHSLAELNEEWEDYKPAEPLIKDEKVRKAVRAWAEACCIEVVEITHSRKCMLRIMDAIANNDEICIDREIGQILDEKVYNIAELCGEEEE